MAGRDALKHGPPERVYVENEWYDGPRAGVADVGGVPHRFKSLFDEGEDEYLETFLVWPLEIEFVALEIEQWCIFVQWNESYEAGKADTESHPGHGGRSARWDELEGLLKASRSNGPTGAKFATAVMAPIEREQRYALSGPAYTLAWRLL